MALQAIQIPSPPRGFSPTAAEVVVGLALIARHGSGARKMAIPFGPFLAFGAVVALFWGDALLDFWDDFSSDGKLEDRDRGMVAFMASIDERLSG